MEKGGRGGGGINILFASKSSCILKRSKYHGPSLQQSLKIERSVKLN